ncbi:long-chain fatty acid--CoA ligase [Paenibacillus thailandensis]|uniref:Long-chain fatty acid--CoA ligase n=1 Tax=Paenibacillus thailandensis TaxID=393250 RepID=A0ABW5R0D2_9BACL
MELNHPEQPGGAAGGSVYAGRPWLASYPQEIPASIDYPNESLPSILTKAAAQFPRNEAIHFFGRSVSYRELHAQAARLSNALRSLGVAKGDRVAIMLPNCPQAVVSYFAVLMLGAVVVQTNPLYVERELEYQLSDSGAVAIITLDQFYARLAAVRGNPPEQGPVPKLKIAVVTSIKDGLPFPKNLLYPIKQRKEGFRGGIPYGRSGVIAYARLLAGQNAEPPETAVGADDLALLQYTGGTTGKPKGVMLTHRNLVANTMQTAAWCYKAEQGRERFLAALPLFHVFGLTVLMNMAVLKAGTLILLPRFETEAVLDTIRRLRPSIFPGAPTMYIALIHHAGASSTDMTSINVCISGSASLPLEVQERFEQLTGGRLIEGYGLTEASPVTHCNPIWSKRKNGTIGIPLPDTEAKIVDSATGEELPPGEIGELLVRGPQVMKGYWNRPAETADALKDGWLKTGDLARMDEEGYFAIVDRIKDVIIAGGFNIYPREVEEVLYEHPGVREAAVIGVKDDYRGETVKAYIVLKDGWQVSRIQLDKWCRERLAAFKVPHLYEFRETLPKSLIGKVLKRKLIEEEAKKARTDAGPDPQSGR